MGTGWSVTAPAVADVTRRDDLERWVAWAQVQRARSAQ